MRKVFKISGCARGGGACNSNMDGRDIIVVMPTGGGKSLTYQLPAVLNPGVTLAGVEAVPLTGNLPKAEQDSINARLGDMANTSGQGSSNGGKDIKLLYCTPEKIMKSQSFLSCLQKLSDAHRLTRIVIDEAHCVSQVGHDFRLEYQNLHILRKLFPEVPIMAVTATCPPLVLEDLLKVLGLDMTVPGEAYSLRDADWTGTVYFTAPLYRPNLHYTVLPKPSEGAKLYSQMAAWILRQLFVRGKISTGVYHADRTNREKDKLLRDWHKGDVKVVCATTFGLGIDKRDVRFVIHHSMSKSLDGFYQESGRAGRDGKDSNCVLFYRAQGASTLRSMTMADKDGSAKRDYFSHTTELSVTPWSTSDASAWGPCGHCDNCTRTPEDYLDKDATIQAWQLLRIIEKVQKTTGNVTLANVTELARSSMGKVFVGTGSKKKHAGTKNEVSIDLDAVCEGKVDMTKECYLRDHSYTTAYKTIAYVQLGERAAQLTRKAKSLKINLNVDSDASEFFLDTDDQEEVDIFGDESRKAWSENFSRKSSTSTLKSQKRKPLVIISDSENNGDDAEGQEDESRKGKVAWSANSKKIFYIYFEVAEAKASSDYL
ncbi:P-loop containing nucleoside triphosphate hydrolase protein [Rhodocollybia butyracea]|uniref:DNA 3'-5' helicase n=1 Tax=Rhodocollybia butyracea TaxID=206335 RepID=A0A9P5PFD4_9AGAR|nr:P-loop containing nucleoside triphosphate hydrolase protein [Rhodocollybia butyracea]